MSSFLPMILPYFLLFIVRKPLLQDFIAIYLKYKLTPKSIKQQRAFSELATFFITWKLINHVQIF